MFAAFFFSSASKCTYVQKKCSSVVYKGRELHTSAATWFGSAVDIQLFSKKQKGQSEYKPFISFQVAIQGDKFPYCVLILFVFHCILLLFKNQTLLKKTRVGYIKRIYRHSLGNILANIMNSLEFMYILPGCNNHMNGMETR